MRRSLRPRPQAAPRISLLISLPPITPRNPHRTSIIPFNIPLIGETGPIRDGSLWVRWEPQKAGPAQGPIKSRLKPGVIQIRLKCQNRLQPSLRRFQTLRPQSSSSHQPMGPLTPAARSIPSRPLRGKRTALSRAMRFSFPRREVLIRSLHRIKPHPLRSRLTRTYGKRY
jgi:hypothetical protein